MSLFEHGHALIVGAGADLPDTVNDAQGIAQILRDPERCAYPPDQVVCLTEAEATCADMLAALDRLAQRCDAQSTVIVYFSGHGYRVDSPLGEFYYLLPNGYDLNRLYQTAVSGQELADHVRAIGAQKLLLLLDCCHAGGVGDSKAPAPPGLSMVKAPLPPQAQALLAEGSGRVIVASSQNDELSFAGKPYSAFTLALIEALSGEGAARQDGYVRVADLAMHARQVVPGRTNNRQHPILHFEQADNFALAYYAGGGTQPKGTPLNVAPQIEPEPGAWTLSGQFDGPVALGGDAIDQRQTMNHSTGGQMIHLGDVGGQAHVSIGGPMQAQPQVQPAAPNSLSTDWDRLWQMLDRLKTQIEDKAPPAQRQEALAQIDALGQAAFADPPDLAGVQAANEWFLRHLPWLSRPVGDVASFIQRSLR